MRLEAGDVLAVAHRLIAGTECWFGTTTSTNALRYSNPHSLDGATDYLPDVTVGFT